VNFRLRLNKKLKKLNYKNEGQLLIKQLNKPHKTNSIFLYSIKKIRIFDKDKLFFFSTPAEKTSLALSIIIIHLARPLILVLIKESV
jgi:hypothetical protein